MSARFSEIVADVRSKLEDLNSAERIEELDAKRLAARQRVRDLAESVPREIARLKAEEAEAKMAFQRSVTVWGNATQALERLQRSAPPFLAPIRDRVAAAANTARAEHAKIVSSLRDLKGISESSRAAASEVRERAAVDDSSIDIREVPPFWNSREHVVRRIADAQSLAMNPIHPQISRGVEVIENHTDHRRRVCATARTYKLSGLAEHHLAIAAEADRLLAILKIRSGDAERAVASCEADERTMRDEIAGWWSSHVKSAKPAGR
jgi:hypothetical protein